MFSRKKWAVWMSNTPKCIRQSKYCSSHYGHSTSIVNGICSSIHATAYTLTCSLVLLSLVINVLLLYRSVYNKHSELFFWILFKLFKLEPFVLETSFNFNFSAHLIRMIINQLAELVISKDPKRILGTPIPRKFLSIPSSLCINVWSQNKCH